jgi:hypothetical protein
MNRKQKREWDPHLILWLRFMRCLCLAYALGIAVSLYFATRGAR